MIIELTDESVREAMAEGYHLLEEVNQECDRIEQDMRSVRFDSSWYWRLSTTLRELENDRIALEAKHDSLVLQSKRKYYIAEPLKPHQLHKLKGTKWVKPERGPQTYPEPISNFLLVLAVLMTPMYIAGAIATGSIILGILAILCTGLAISGLFDRVPVLNNAYHNAMIRRTDVDKIKLYQLDGNVASPLHVALDVRKWQRLLDSLEADDKPALAKIFVNYYEDMAETQEAMNEINNSSMPSEVASQLHDQLSERATEICSDAADQINQIFAAEDAFALEAMRQMDERIDAKLMQQQIEAAMNDQFKNQMVVQKAAFVLGKQRR